MIAGRRARRRSLIRTGAMAAIMARTLSAVDNAAKRSPDQKYSRQNGVSAEPFKSSLDRSLTSPTPYAAPGPQLDLAKYLRQLSALHAAGVLTDEEFAAAKGRLFSSS